MVLKSLCLRLNALGYKGDFYLEDVDSRQGNMYNIIIYKGRLTRMSTKEKGIIEHHMPYGQYYIISRSLFGIILWRDVLYNGG